MSANQTPGLSDKTPLGYEGTSALQSLLETVAERLRAQKLIAIKGIRVLPEYAGDLYNQLNSRDRISGWALLSKWVLNLATQAKQAGRTC
jgi:hypothetical protein